jgi:hypothetical protein
MTGSNKILLALNLLLAGSLAAAIWHRISPVAGPPRLTETPPARANGNIELLQELQPYSDLKTESDWRQWIDKLRAQGVPSPVLARLAQAGFEDGWKQRQAEFQAAYMKGDIDTPGLAIADIQREREEEKAMRAALGDAGFRQYDRQIVLRGLPLQNVSLSSLESDSLYDIEKKLLRVAQDLNEKKLKGELTQSEYESLMQQSQAEHDQYLKTLIGDERYATMNPPANEVAEKLQKDLRNIPIPADVSFDALVDIQNQWNERRAEVQVRLQEAKSQTDGCEDELRKVNSVWEMEFERVLGTNGMDTAQKQTDPRYKEMERNADALSLDSAAVDYVFRTIRYYEKLAEDHQQQTRAREAKGEAVDWDASNKSLQEFAQLTQEGLQRYLGQDRFNQLKLKNILPFAPNDPPASD